MKGLFLVDFYHQKEAFFNLKRGGMGMFCKKCGKELKKRTKFCPYCGEKQDDLIFDDEENSLQQSKHETGKSQVAIIIASVIFGVAIIIAAFVMIWRPNDRKEAGAPVNMESLVEETTSSGTYERDVITTDEESGRVEEETQSILSVEQEQEKREVENKFSNLSSQNVSNAFSSERDLIASYKMNTENYIKSANFVAARAEMEQWENLLQAIQNMSNYEMDVKQIDVNEYPRIKVYVRIQDKVTQKAVSTLTQGGFYIYEKLEGGSDFVRRDIIRALQLNNEEKVNISMVADVSGSMGGSPILQAKNQMNNFLNSVQIQAGDCVSLISFTDQVDIQTSFSNDIAYVGQAVGNLIAGGDTALYDALYVAINQTAAQEGAKCVIAFTDGADNRSKCTPEIVAQLAQRYSIPVFIIGIGTGLDTSELSYIANTSHGFYRNINDIRDMTEIYNAIFREQKELYLVEYETLQQNEKQVVRNININYIDETFAVRKEYQYVPSVYMEVNTSMAEMFVNDFIIYDSDRRYVTGADLDRLDKEQLRIARNEIYARRGRKFNDQYLQGYFNARGWYQGTVAPEAFRESMFNDYERANAYFIADYERLKGYIR